MLRPFTEHPVHSKLWLIAHTLSGVYCINVLPICLSVIAADEILLVGALHHPAVGQFGLAEREIDLGGQLVTRERKSAGQLLHLTRIPVDISVASADGFIVVVAIGWTSGSVELIEAERNRNFVDVLPAIFPMHLTSVVV